MLDDREYMRERPGFGFGGLLPLPAWAVILLVNLVVFVAQNAGGPSFDRAVTEYGALSLEGLRHGFLWQLFTFQFMHGSLGHLLFNSLALYFFGRPMESQLGRRVFLNLYVVSGLIGGLTQVLLALISSKFGGAVVGASAGICGLVAAFALLNPHSTIYLFLILPLRALYFLPLMISLTVVFMLFPNVNNVAHGAHLGGMLAGCAWIRFGWHRDFVQLPWENLFDRLRGWKPLQARERKRELVRAATVPRNGWREPDREAEVRLPPEDFISREVDPILDKISKHGIHSLTDKERKILEAARKKMS